MENLFNKIVNLGESLSKLSNDDLRKHGIESIMMFAWSTDFESVALSKGRFEYVMSMVGQTEIKQREQEGGDPDDLY